MTAIPRNLGQIVQDTRLRLPSKKAVLFKSGGHYQSHSWQEFFSKIVCVSDWLSSLDLDFQSKVAILSENRPEWSIIDFGCLLLGHVSVPIYTSLTSAEIQYILQDAEVKVLAVSNKTLLEKLIPVQRELPHLQAVLVLDSSLLFYKDRFTIPIVSMREVENRIVESFDVSSHLSRVQPSDLASIIYTSGTTGKPKGVMLTHDNFVQNLLRSRTALEMHESDVHLSFLPLSHVFERMAGHFLMVYLGATIAYAENMETVPQNLLEIQPSFVVAVPRFYEKIQSKILGTISQESRLKQKIFQWARLLGTQKRELEQSHAKFSPAFKLKLFFASKLVYQKIREKLGGRVRFCVSGGAPLSVDVATFFYDLGLMIFEGYGLSETAPVISANRPGRFKFGTVGVPLDDIQIKISQDGEILTKSACVMKGYYKKELETAEVIDAEGWFHTGDLGQIDSDGFLKITGRKKEIIVTSGGKKISPGPIEELILTDPLFLRCVLYGDTQRFITALIVPNPDKLVELAKEQKIQYSNYSHLVQDEKIYYLIDQKIQLLTKDLANYEKIKYFYLVEHDFSQEEGQLTPTLKVKRKVVVQKYQSELNALYLKDKH